MDVEVTRVSDDTYSVAVSDGGSPRTTHSVVVTPGMLERYGAGATPERLLEESFAFLLEREPPESILRSFPIEAIERYFPEYPDEIRRRLSR